MENKKTIWIKILLSFVTIIIMYFLPIILIKILDFTNPGDELAALSHYLGYGLLGIMLIFFIIYPIALAILGIIAGTDIKNYGGSHFYPFYSFYIKLAPK